MQTSKDLSDKQQEILENLPSKKYFTIGEVSKICDIKDYVLRYWEKTFPQLKPNCRQGRRYYQNHDIQLVLKIKNLLYYQGFTLSGAKSQLANNQNSPNQIKTDTKTKTNIKKINNEIEIMQIIHSELIRFKNHIQSKY